MNWQTVITLTVIFAVTAIIHARTLARRRRGFLLLWAIIALLVLRWASFRDAWTQVGVAAGAAFLLLLAWWVLLGRRLAPPDDNNIRVWTEEDPF
ncbi:MAG TPA: hypothetical protein VGA52_01605 [Anaerolineales bacterium]|jgi:Ca2+/Na+ antiporter